MNRDGHPSPTSNACLVQVHRQNTYVSSEGVCRRVCIGVRVALVLGFAFGVRTCIGVRVCTGVGLPFYDSTAQESHNQQLST